VKKERSKEFLRLCVDELEGKTSAQYLYLGRAAQASPFPTPFNPPHLDLYPASTFFYSFIMSAPEPFTITPVIFAPSCRHLLPQHGGTKAQYGDAAFGPRCPVVLCEDCNQYIPFVSSQASTSALSSQPAAAAPPSIVQSTAVPPEPAATYLGPIHPVQTSTARKCFCFFPGHGDVFAANTGR
jgi:hypothetical protein